MPTKRSSKTGQFQANGGRQVPTASTAPRGKPGPAVGTKQNPESGRARAAEARREARREAVREVILEDIRASRHGYSNLSSGDIAARLSQREDAAELAASPASVRSAIAQLISSKRLVRATRRMSGERGEASWSLWTRNSVALPDASVGGARHVLAQEAEVAERHARFVQRRPGASPRINTPSAVSPAELETIAEQLAREAQPGRFAA